MSWKFRDGARGHKVAADVVGIEIARIQQDRGAVRASVVVEESRPSAAPLHHEFDWDDPHAASQFRLIQARTLIRDVVFVEPQTSEPLQFYHVPSGDGSEGHYEFVKRLVNVQSEYQAALGELLVKLESLEESVTRLLAAATGSTSPSVSAILSSVAATVASAKAALSKLPPDA